MNYTIKNEELTITVASKGAELQNITDNRTGREHLWNGDSAYWGRISPVLFPLVGNYFEHESVYDGKTYTLGQHGFARDAEFVLIRQSDDSLTFRLEASEETKKVYPFNFALEVGYELTGREVKVLWKVKNEEEEIIYFSIGAHPAFPADLSTWSLQFDTEKDLEIEYLDTATGCLGDRIETVSLQNGVLSLTPELFDDDALILEGDQTKKITLLNDRMEPQVDVAFEASVVGIWSPAKKGAPFVCIEPWYGRSDRNGFNKKLEEREHGHSLKKGEEFNASYTMHIF